MLKKIMQFINDVNEIKNLLQNIDVKLNELIKETKPSYKVINGKLKLE